MPLQQFVQHLYFKPFGKQRLAVVLTIDVVVTIEEKVRPDSPSTMEIWHQAFTSLVNRCCAMEARPFGESVKPGVT
jgi:hypothetical protein